MEYMYTFVVDYDTIVPTPDIFFALFHIVFLGLFATSTLNFSSNLLQSNIFNHSLIQKLENKFNLENTRL